MSPSTPAPPPQARELAARWNLHRAGREWRGTCPACGYAAAFVLTERGGRAAAWCASCQDRDAISALLRAGGAPHRPDPERGAASERDRLAKAERARERARALWNGAEAAPGTPAAVYLATRGLLGLAASPALRWRADCPHPAGGRLPALLGRIDGPDGAMTGLHRTYLRRDGAGKTERIPVKASLGPVRGGAVRLHGAGPSLVVGEGIETSAAAGLLTGMPAWAAISAGNLARALTLPPAVREVVIAVDNDPPGRRAAADAAARWLAEGRRVRFLVPDADGADAADLVQGAAR